MDNKRIEVENEIVIAATRVFIAKGFKGATMRDIAAEANINLAMLNYYFRSKENLFDIILDKAFIQLYSTMLGPLLNEKPFFDKIRDLVSSFITVLIENPSLPSFIFSEVSHAPDKLTKKIQTHKEFFSIISNVQTQIDNEASAGKMKHVQFVDFFINLESLCAFPFIARPILSTVFNISDMNYGAMLERRKTIVADILIGSLEI